MDTAIASSLISVESTTGAWVFEPIFNATRNPTEGLALARRGRQHGFIDSTGTFVLTLHYEQVFPFKENRARVSEDGLWGFIDRTGEAVVSPSYLGAGDFSGGRALVLTSDGYGFIDPQGVMVIPPRYERASSFDRGLAWVTLEGRSGYIDTTGIFIWREEE